MTDRTPRPNLKLTSKVQRKRDQHKLNRPLEAQRSESQQKEVREIHRVLEGLVQQVVINSGIVEVTKTIDVPRYLALFKFLDL